MKARAIQRYIHSSSQKAKLVVDLIRNKPVIDALNILKNTNKKMAVLVEKLLNQAIANATNNHAMDASKLYVYHIVANQAPTLKRTNPRARGSADLLKKRYCHIEIILSDDENERKNDIAKQKAIVKKRAANNKGYSAKQRKALASSKKTSTKKSTKNIEMKAKDK